MAAKIEDGDSLEVIGDQEKFDKKSGSFLERIIFNNRHLVVFFCFLITIFLSFHASKVVLNASYEKLLPSSHPYIQNLLENRIDLKTLGNSVRISVENVDGDIFNPAYLEALKQINDSIFFVNGVDRAWMKSIWTPVVRWSEVTEEGFVGGPVMPPDYDGSSKAVADLRNNISKSGILGTLVAKDFKSSVIYVPLLDKDPTTGKNINYEQLSSDLEAKARNLIPDSEKLKIKVHIVGFAKLVGDLIDGIFQVMTYFAVAVFIALILIYWHTKCMRSTALLLGCSLVAVIWQFGLVVYIGYELNPYSVLVPFLVFAIGVSHGAQKMNGIKQDIAKGTHRYVAARYTFRRLFLAGLTALVADAVAFAVLMFIDIPVIKELALIASMGVATLIFTNLILLPVLLSYVGVKFDPAEALNDRQANKKSNRFYDFLIAFTNEKPAVILLSVVFVFTSVCFLVSLNLKIGDIEPGASELRQNSRYNQDVAFFNKHYGASNDQFAVIVKTPFGGCEQYQTLTEIDRLAVILQQLPVVKSTLTLADPIRQVTAGTYEGNPKWLSLSRNQQVINYASKFSLVNTPELMNSECRITPVIASLTDHKAETLSLVLKTVEDFSKENSKPDLQFLPVAGSAGVEAVTNIVVQDANRKMLLYVYASVIILCFITFRSWMAVMVAIVPLIVTSILCEALMVALGIGVKIATLPVVALGVGIGVDYALYLLSIQLAYQRSGMSLTQAYGNALMFTGKVVALVGITLAAGVVTWALSPIKFQADMGILLAFMFIWNMIGALILIPALSYFLLNKVPVKALK